ncbi:MAG: hypothetical protein ACRENP_15380 [Longimicrobiales bacterium]
MSYFAYKLLHFVGIFTMVTALASTAMRGLLGAPASSLHRRVMGAAHGLAALAIMLGGFGMLARMGIIQAGLPAWVMMKVAIWFVLVAAIVLPRFGTGYARALLVVLPLLAGAACATALYKPF